MEVCAAFINAVKTAGYSPDTPNTEEWETSLKSLFTLYEKIPETVDKIALAHFKVEIRSRIQDEINNLSEEKESEKKEINAILKEIEEEQPKINQLCNLIKQKLKSSTISSPIDINTMPKGPTDLQSVSDLKEKYSDLHKKTRSRFDVVTTRKNLFTEDYQEVEKVIQLVLTDEYTIKNASRTFLEKVKKLKQSQEHLHTDLKKIEIIFEEYIKERYQWIKLLREYTETVSLEQLALLLDGEKKQKTEPKRVQFSLPKRRPCSLLEKVLGISLSRIPLCWKNNGIYLY